MLRQNINTNWVTTGHDFVLLRLLWGLRQFVCQCCITAIFWSYATTTVSVLRQLSLLSEDISLLETLSALFTFTTLQYVRDTCSCSFFIFPSVNSTSWKSMQTPAGDFPKITLPLILTFKLWRLCVPILVVCPLWSPTAHSVESLQIRSLVWFVHPSIYHQGVPNILGIPRCSQNHLCA